MSVPYGEMRKWPDEQLRKEMDRRLPNTGSEELLWMADELRGRAMERLTKQIKWLTVAAAGTSVVAVLISLFDRG